MNSALLTLLPRLRTAAVSLLIASTLTGCAAAIVGGAATTAIVASDRRTTGEQVEDRSIIMKAGAESRRLLENQPGRVNANSYAGQVLLTGDVPNEQLRAEIGKRVSGIEKVDSVINRIRIGAPTELSVRTNDSWITTKVTSALINTKDVPSRTISVTTERGVVYLQGYVTHDEGERAAKAAAHVEGVNKVVKLFQYIKAESLLLRKDPEKSLKEESTPSNESQQMMHSSDGPEVMAIE